MAIIYSWYSFTHFTMLHSFGRTKNFLPFFCLFVMTLFGGLVSRWSLRRHRRKQEPAVAIREEEKEEQTQEQETDEPVPHVPARKTPDMDWEHLEFGASRDLAMLLKNWNTEPQRLDLDDFLAQEEEEQEAGPRRSNSIFGRHRLLLPQNNNFHRLSIYRPRSSILKTARSTPNFATVRP